MVDQIFVFRKNDNSRYSHKNTHSNSIYPNPKHTKMINGPSKKFKMRFLIRDLEPVMEEVLTPIA